MLTAPEKARYASWKVKIRHAIQLCEEKKFYETLEHAKALALFTERQAQARETLDITGLDKAMERAFSLRLARLTDTYQREARLGAQ